MKKFHPLYILLMCMLTAMPAVAQTTTTDYTVTFSVYIEDPTLCYFVNNGGERISPVKGDNILTAIYHETISSDGSISGYGDNITLNIAEGKESAYFIKSCDVELASSSRRTPFSGFYSPGQTMYINIDRTMDGAVFYPDIVSYAAARTATANVWVEDASKAQIRCGSYVPHLESGDNVVRFMPDLESHWQIGPAEYGTYLGDVTLNGSSVDNLGSFFDIPQVADGDNIRITTTAIVLPANVTISFANAGTENSILTVTEFVNHTTHQLIEDWRNGFTVNNHSEITLSLNTRDYKFNSITLNGVPQSLVNSPVFISISRDSEIIVDAVPFETFNMPMSITDPAHIRVYAAESLYGSHEELENLQAGEQDVPLKVTTTVVLVEPKLGVVMDRVAYVNSAGKEKTVQMSQYSSSYAIDLSLGVQKIIVESHAKVRAQQATLWLDANPKETLYAFNMAYADNANIFNYATYGASDDDVLPQQGEQTFWFDAATDNPINLRISFSDYGRESYVYLNGVRKTPDYSDNYSLYLADNDELKVYVNASQDPFPPVRILNATADTLQKTYTLQGVETTNTSRPGIYIVNGKKKVIR